MLIHRLLRSAVVTTALASTACGGVSIDTFDTGNWPVAIVYDGEHLWIANQLDSTVSKLARDGITVGTYPVSTPVDHAFDGQAIWVANTEEGSVTKLALDGSVLGTFDAGTYPVALAFDGESVWVANNDLVFRQ